MELSDHTDIGGDGQVFLTTHWSLIENACSSVDRDQALIGVLLQKYWKPVYCYLRRKGYPNEEAKDMTQGFFCEIVLNKNLVQRADKTKGRFRTFLLHALNQYVINQIQRQSAQKRIPKDKLISIDMLNPPAVPDMVTSLEPEESYNYAWLSALLDEILCEVEEDCKRDGLELHWKVFVERVIEPLLKDTCPPSLADLRARHGIEDEKKVSNMAITVKRRFQTALRKHVGRTVLAQDQISEELGELMRFFRKDAQHT